MAKKKSQPSYDEAFKMTEAERQQRISKYRRPVSSDTSAIQPLPRRIGVEGQGSSGDIRDRFRGAYKPGANPTLGPTPLESAIGIGKDLIQRIRGASKTSPSTRVNRH